MTIPVDILLVEDDENLSWLLRENLQRSHYRVHAFQLAGEAIKSMSQQNYQVALIDLMLPDQNGFEVARTLKQLQPQCPFVFLTAVRQDAERYQGYETGADDYITKPFSYRELDYKLQVILRRTSSTIPLTEAWLEVEDMALNTRSRKLRIGEHTFKLTQRESDLLQIFMQRYGDFVTRNEILISFWGRDDQYTARSMDVYIVRLRKLLAHSSRLGIENLYGSGHRLIRIKE